MLWIYLSGARVDIVGSGRGGGRGEVGGDGHLAGS